MNIKTIIVGSLAIALAVGSAVFNLTSSDKQSAYTPRNSSQTTEHFDYLNKFRIDPSTGVIDPNMVIQVRNEVMARRKQKNKSAIGLNWTQMGPDNVGGRTRAILVDQSNPNTVYAGSVAGGLFVSFDATGTWIPVGGHQGTQGENLMISCITQTQNGRIFFGTGSVWEGATGPYPGNGVYEYFPASGDVLPVITNAVSLPNNNPSATLSEINSIEALGNRLYIGTGSGFYWADATGPNDVNGNPTYPTVLGSWTNPLFSVGTIPETSRIHDIDIGSDGAFMVCADFGRIYTSNSDAVGSFTQQTRAAGRFVAAIAPSNPNVYYLLRNSGNLIAFEISQDKGATWDILIPGGSPCIDPFTQDDCSGGQGIYDACMAIDPSDWGHVLVGGIQLYEFRLNLGSNPIGGSWLKAAVLNPQSVFNPVYMHADKHTIVWPDANTIYVGSDGGVNKSTDGGVFWQQRNLGYNVTTFYDMSIASNNWFMGGAQDNGTQLYTYGATGEVTPLGATEINSGDGFFNDFSNFSGGIAYTTSQNGNLRRQVSGGAGGTFFNNELNNLVFPGPANDPTGGNGQPFATIIEAWENPYDPLTVDSVELYFDSLGTNIYANPSNPVDSIAAGDTIFAGTTLYYESLTNGEVLEYVVPANIILNYPADTITLHDPMQNKFAFATSQGVYLTRDAARLNALSPEWFRVANNTNVNCFQFSPDGNHLYIGSGSQLTRVSGLSLGNTYNALDIRNNVTMAADPDSNRLTTVTVIGNFSTSITGIAVDPNNGENVIVTCGGYTSTTHVHRSQNAESATSNAGTFVGIQGAVQALPPMPVYDAEIDWTDNDRVIIGTEWGVWTSDNAFSAPASLVEWTDESNSPMGHVPVTTVIQQFLGSDYALNSGVVYLGTYGRGFYLSEDLRFVSVDENDSDDLTEKDGFVSDLNVYPNPLNNAGTISFDLNENRNTKVKIYNLTGSLAKTIDLGKLAKGNHKVRFDATSLSVGSYIISLESNNERSIAKFIVTR